MTALLWHLENQNAAARREALEAKGWRIPDSLYPPDVYPGTEAWVTDYFELGTDRQIGMNGAGPIPAATLTRHTSGWPEDEAALFRHAMRALDRAYLNSIRPDGDIPETDNPARDAFRASMR